MNFRLPGQFGQDWDFDDDGIPYQIPPIPAPVINPRREYISPENKILRIKAEHGQLPEFLTLDEIAYLYGYEPYVFKEFVQDWPLEIEYRETPYEDNGEIFIHKTTGFTRGKFKAFLQNINRWPIKNCLLANWWKYADIQPEKNGKSKPDLTKTERTMLLTMVIGMAMDAYAYEPGGQKNTATGEKDRSIKAAVERSGMSIDNGTVSKYLKEAEKLLPPQSQ